MKPAARSKASRALAVAPVVAYFVLTHIAVSGSQLRYGLVAILVVAACAGLLGRVRIVWIAAAALMAPLSFADFDPRLLLYFPPIVVNALLCWLFGRTLLGHREPFISRIARIDRGVLPVELAHYTRRLTWIWTLFFALIATASAALAWLAPQELWALFNDTSYLFAGLLFFGEFVYRRLRYHRYPHSSALHVIRRIRELDAFRS
ncbi:MAG: hypothetical protein M3Q32_09575 [Pseudomonadota bacterium]|nr:hypothetical protein [Pseudomonadota bacterium]